MLPFVYFILLIAWGELSPQFLKKNLSYKIIGGFLNTRLKDIENYNNVDILVLGPSGAYRGFDPRIFKKHQILLFNLGSSSQTPVQTEILVNQYLRKIKPKMVLYCLYPDMFNENGTESMVDLISNDSLDCNIAKKAFYSLNINVINTFSYTYYKRLINPDNNEEVWSVSPDDKYINGGFVEKNTTSTYKPRNFQSVNLKINNNQLEAFKNVIITLSKNNVKIVFINPPLTENFYNSFANKETINNFFGKLPFTQLNYNHYPFNKDNFFYDQAHLNSEGVNFFNYEVIDTLQTMKLLK